MKVYALVGSSGSGKSYRATWISKIYKLEAIIDDGLLIGGNKVLAGISAKREPTKIASIKRALFKNDNHVLDVKSAIRKQDIKSILILGTSDGMVNEIARVLGLGTIEKFVYIEDISSPEEIATAKRIRKDEGKHVIPVPTFEIQQDFSGYFLSSVKLFFGKSRRIEPEFDAEKTIVRPTFSYLGNFTISDRVLMDLCHFEAKKCREVYKALNTNIQNTTSGVNIDMDVVLEYGNYNIPKVIVPLQGQIRKSIEYLTAINLCNLNINVKNLHVK